MRSSVKLFVGAFALASPSIVASVGAAPIPVQNFSFENPPDANANNYPPPTNWLGGGFTENSLSVGLQNGVGLQYGGIDAGTITQDLGVLFQPNSTYTVRALVGNRAGFQEGLTQYGLQGGLVPADLGTIASIDNEAVIAENTFVEGPVYSFTTGAVAPAGNVTVFLRGALDSANNNRGIFDNVRVDVAEVPEPASLGLLALAGAGLLARRRRTA